MRKFITYETSEFQQNVENHPSNEAPMILAKVSVLEVKPFEELRIYITVDFEGLILLENRPNVQL